MYVERRASYKVLIFTRFATTTSFQQALPELRQKILKKLKVPSYLFDSMYLESNGFAGCDTWIDQNGAVEAHGK